MRVHCAARTEACDANNRHAVRTKVLNGFFLCRTCTPRNSGANSQSTLECADANVETSTQIAASVAAK
jgi:hypothetical protein